LCSDYLKQRTDRNMKLLGGFEMGSQNVQPFIKLLKVEAELSESLYTQLQDDDNNDDLDEVTTYTFITKYESSEECV